MSKRVDKEIKSLMRRLALLRDVSSGSVRLRAVTVHRKKMRWMVNAKVRTYVRYVAPKGWKPK